MKQENSRYWIGLVFVIVGVLFIFKNFNIPFFNQLDIFQFLIPILLLFWAYESYKKNKQVLALILGLVGGTMLFDSIGFAFLGFNLLDKLLLPGIFIVIGYTILNKQNKRQDEAPTFKSDQRVNKTYYSPGAEIDETVIDSSKIENDQVDAAFQATQSSYTQNTSTQGGSKNRQLSTVFSSQRVFYNKADFQPGNTHMDVTCVFGDLDMIFSKDINLHVVANVTMADLNFIGNKVGGIMNKYEETYLVPHSDVHIYLSLSVVFGDVDIIHNR